MIKGHRRSWKVMEGQGRSRKVMDGGVGGVIACRIILSAPVPFLWTLDLGFGYWIWDLDLGLGFGTGLELDNCQIGSILH